MNGVADQIMALSWTKQNAKAFGGNPDQITIFGVSAGGLSVCEIMVSPLSAGLFKNAIIESGPCMGPWGPKTEETGLDIGVRFMQEFNAKTLDDLRKISATRFFASPSGNLIGPAVDGYVITGLPSENQKFQFPSNGSLIIGGNSLDSILADLPFPETPTEYEAVLTKFFANDAPEVLQHYPSGSSSPEITFQIINYHLCVACPSRAVAEAVSATNPAFVYEYSYNSVSGEYFNKAAHAAEVGLVFGYEIPPFSFDPQLSKQMVDYWTSFASTGDPTSIVKWPQFSSTGPTRFHQNLNSVVSSMQGYYDEQCGFWKTYAARGAVPLNRTNNYCLQVVS